MVPEQISVGSIECLLLSDGEGVYTSDLLFGDPPGDELEAALEGWRHPDGSVRTPYRCLLVRAGDRTILIDTGLGDFAQVIGSPAGYLSDSLTQAGVEPDDIDVVVISHGHPDHIGGLTDGPADARVPRYRSARHYVQADEWRFWTTDEGLALVPDVMATPARMNLPPLEAAGLVETVDGEHDVVPGVRLIPAPGHTPGHMIVAITSGRESLLYAADVISHDLGFEHPDWQGPFEAIPELSRQTRRKLLEDAVRSQTTWVGFHLSGPGTVEKSGEGYRLVESPS
jgi:glyoxylase-like metal-dependent hydrolase (beta-lactamase superfamily II)